MTQRRSADVPAAARGAANGARLAFLDSLRALAAAAVVLQHLFEVQRYPAMTAFVGLGPGVFGVALFFLLSGFVIPFSVKHGFDPRSFAIRRLFRIMPLALAAFLIAWALGRAGFPPEALAARATAAAWAANLLLINDYVGAPAIHGVTWTLSIELAWYALFAIMLMRRGARAGTLLEIATPLLFAALALGSVVAGHRLPLGRIGMIYAAVMGYQCCRHFQGEIGARRLAADAAAFVAIMTAGNMIAFGYFRHPTVTMAQAVWPWLLATGVFLLVYAWRPLRAAPLLTSPVVATLGTISFSTYLLHPFAIFAAQAWCPPGLALNALALALTLLLSIAGYRLVEVPGMAIGKRLAHRAAPRIAVRAV